MKIVKRDEMRAIEQFAIDEVGISGAVLMEIAGNQVAEEIIRSYPDPVGADRHIDRQWK